MHNKDVPVDSILVERIVNNDQAAILLLLLDDCGPRLNYLVNVKYHSLGWQFDELVSELYLLLSKDNWRALKCFRGANSSGMRCSLVNYVVLIASRLMTKRVLSGKRAQMTLDDCVMARIPEPDSPRQRAKSEIMQAIQMMENGAERDILILVKIHGYDFQEVAKTLNISVDNAYARCSRGMKHLRELLNEEDVHA